MKILKKSQKNKGFTIVELIVCMALFSLLIVGAFDVFWKISVWKVRVSNKLDADKDIFYSLEKFFYLVKSGWDIDYEEYWNRSVIWTSTSSWYYNKFSWYGNYGSWWNMVNDLQIFWDNFYFCRSNVWEIMGSTWCLDNFNWNSWSYLWTPQRYWQYALQSIDFNSNADADWVLAWDENGDWKITWDDDDDDMWVWPESISWNEVKELYLIKNWKNPVRNYFRLIYRRDPDAPSSAVCDPWTNSFSWCVWNIQTFKMVWMDLWSSHNWVYDWKIDTWCCDSDYNCSWNTTISGCQIPLESDIISNTWSWVDIFPSYFNVKEAKFFVYPNKDYKSSWKEDWDNIAINPYVRIKLNIWFAWKERARMWSDVQMSLYTTLNLSK